MSRLHRAINLVAVVVPFLCFIAALVLLWNSLVGGQLTVLVLMYLLTGLGITVGFHRLFTHRSFETYRRGPVPVRRCSARWPSRARCSSGSPDHRKHHRHSDQRRRPPHPHHGDGPGRGARAASGTRTSAGCSARRDAADLDRYVKDLLAGPRPAR